MLHACVDATFGAAVPRNVIHLFLAALMLAYGWQLILLIPILLSLAFAGLDVLVPQLIRCHNLTILSWF